MPVSSSVNQLVNQGVCVCVCVGGDDSGGDGGGGVDLPATPQHTDFIPQGLI